jgi:predicted ATPase/class 3 adenylate cyclase/TolA-binding protein
MLDANVQVRRQEQGAIMASRAPDPSTILTFLFADIRGYTRFTAELGDEAAARLASRFASVARDVVTEGGGKVYELVGDQAVAVFASARQALRTAVALQRRLADERSRDPSLPLHAGIGLDAGEPVAVEGGYRGGPLNLAARLCTRAGPGEIFASDGVIHLARATEGIDVVDRGAVHLKGIDVPVRVLQVGAAGTLPESLPPLEPPQQSNNLPAQLTSFVGRLQERGKVKKLLEGARLVTLTGTGGAGKTRLSLQVAEELNERYSDGVWLVELAPVADPTLVTQTVALALGLREQPERTLSDALVDFLAPKRLLLLLDNCEHLVDACREAAAKLLRACPQVRILATSREVLGVPGEVSYRVPALALPDPEVPLELLELEEKDAIRLFVERARERRMDFVVTQENASAVVEICARLDGVPLAIELAAARVGVLAPQQLLSRLEDRFRLLTGGSAGTPSRQRTLRATLDWSYELLSNEERTLLQRLSVFAGVCTLEAAEAVGAGDLIESRNVLDLLESLVNKSLVQVDEQGGEVRYSLLETVRQYAHERLAEAGEVEIGARKHADWYADLARQAEPALLGGWQVVWLDRLEAERANLRAAVDWSLADAGHERADAERGLSMAASLWRFWELRGPLSEGRRWLEETLQVAGDANPAFRARSLTAVGHLAVVQGEVEAARESLDKALGIWHDCPASSERRRGEASALLDLGAAALARGESDVAGARYDESLALWRELGDEWGIAGALEGLGRSAQKRLSIEGRMHVQGELERAAELYSESLALRQKIGDAWGVARAHLNLATVGVDQGESVRAAEQFQRALDLARELRDVQTTGSALMNLGVMAIYGGKAVEAEEPLNAALTLYRQVGATAQRADALYWLGDAALLRSEFQLAEDRFAEAEIIYQKLGHTDGRAWMHSCRGNVAQCIGQFDRAAVLLEESLLLYRPDDQGMNPAMTHAALGEARFGQGQLEDAEAEYRECLAIVRGQSSPETTFIVSWNLAAQAQMAAARSEFERAAYVLGVRAAIRRDIELFAFPNERAEVEEAERLARTALGDEGFAAAYSATRDFSLREALELGLGIEPE